MSGLKATPEDVRHAYRLLLGREPDPDGFRHYCAILTQDQPAPGVIAEYLMESTEFRERHHVLTKADAGRRPEPGVVTLSCQACTQAQIESPTFRYWAASLREKPGGLHRKLWEWCYITQALYERGMLEKGRRGLGFAVGTEPLSALFAKMQCSILASDIGEEVARDAGWVDTNQHAASLEQLNQRGLCPPAEFAERVRFREVDMRDIPADLRGFDFLWSSCALEHLGSLQHGVDYVLGAMDCLRDGGVAVHTTELNCDSDEHTIETGGSVVYRKRDLLQLAERLRALGHRVEPFNFDLGDSAADAYVDEPPYRGRTHLKLRLGPYASTSFGLIVTKHGAPV
ncbi:MAG: hypothetical protein GXC76_04685 [Rhodanobacteraceae bacterium]|jgi:hypothetical protein|nr:hypothetical protein [Rhodanobacteraceae bacterium]